MKQKVLILSFLIFSFSLKSQEISINKVDEVVENTMKTFNVPGIAVGIIHDGKVVLAKGYGVSSIKTGEKVNAQTNFGIASNSKAFTTTAIAMLVDQGKMKWDDKVIQYIPEFKMYNEYVTQEFTVRDLVTHRSGLGLGAGDLMIWPDGHDFTPQDIIRNIHHLKPVSDFRTKYDYDNLLYIIAGVVVERVSGMSWTEFIQKNFLTPLKMNRTAPNWNLLKDKSNSIDPHVPIEGKLEVIERYTNPIFDGAAGIYSNVEDLTKWLQFQLDLGKTQDGLQLISEPKMRELTKPQTWMPSSTRPPYNTLFRAYALGYQIQDIAGKLEVSHTGGLEGIVTQLIMYPQLNLGIIVLTNQQEGFAFYAISNYIKDHYLGLPERNWVKEFEEISNNMKGEADKVTEEVWGTVAQNKNAKSDAKNLLGTYRDNWFGDVTIKMEKGKMRFESKRSTQLKGDMFYYKDNTYAVKWDNAYLHADAFVFVQVENNQVIGLKMAPISPLTDFSYDFQDLDFKKISN